MQTALSAGLQLVPRKSSIPTCIHARQEGADSCMSPQSAAHPLDQCLLQHLVDTLDLWMLHTFKLIRDNVCFCVGIHSLGLLLLVLVQATLCCAHLK